MEARTAAQLEKMRAELRSLQQAFDVVRGLGLLLYGNSVQWRVHKHGSEKWTIEKRNIIDAPII
jgi:hypothetical protein